MRRFNCEVHGVVWGVHRCCQAAVEISPKSGHVDGLLERFVDTLLLALKKIPHDCPSGESDGCLAGMSCDPVMHRKCWERWVELKTSVWGDMKKAVTDRPVGYPEGFDCPKCGNPMVVSLHECSVGDWEKKICPVCDAGLVCDECGVVAMAHASGIYRPGDTVAITTMDATCFRSPIAEIRYFGKPLGWLDFGGIPRLFAKEIEIVLSGSPRVVVNGHRISDIVKVR